MRLHDIPLSGNSFKRGVAGSFAGLALGSFLSLVGCSGTISDAHKGVVGSDPRGGGASGGNVAGGNGANGTSGGASGFVCPANTVEPGPAPLRLLTQDQYLNTVHDLLGDIAQLDTVFDRTGHASVFGLQQGDVSQVALESYQKAAEIIGTATVANATKLKTIAPCATGADKRGCARTFVQSFGALAYRAPVVDAADIDRHLAVYDVGAKTSHEHGLELVLRSMLQSARFLYRVELGTAEKVAPTAVKLSGYEASAPSLVRGVGHHARREADLVGGERRPVHEEGAASALQSMIADARGAKVVRRFLEQWSHLGISTPSPRTPRCSRSGTTRCARP